MIYIYIYTQSPIQLVNPHRGALLRPRARGPCGAVARHRGCGAATEAVPGLGGIPKSPSHHGFHIGSMYAIYGIIYHQYTPNVSIYTIHGSYGICFNMFQRSNLDDLIWFYMIWYPPLFYFRFRMNVYINFPSLTWWFSRTFETMWIFFWP